MRKRFCTVMVNCDLPRTRQFFSTKKIQEITEELISILKKTSLLEGKKFIFIAIDLVDTKKIKVFNKFYRNKNTATDVLSFEQDLKLQPKEMLFLGDLVLCPEIILRQAKRLKLPPYRELELILCHGLLHLLGYDHEKSKKKAFEMSCLEAGMLTAMKNPFWKKHPQTAGLIVRTQGKHKV